MTAVPVQPIESQTLSADDGVRDSVANASMLMLTSVLLLHMAIQDGSQQPWVEWVDLVVTGLLAALAFSVFKSRRGSGTTSVVGNQHRDRFPSTSTLVVPAPQHSQLTTSSLPSPIEIGFLVLFAILPFITDVILRNFFAHGNPWEILVTLSLRNLMFGLVALSRSSTKRLAIFTSLFLAIYGSLVTVSATTNVLLAAYALFGLWWLMGNYWQRISAHFPDESTTEIPYFARVGAVGLVLCCLGSGAIAFNSNAVTSAIAGFMPSSGGTGGNDPFARGGVGDGDQMVGATEDANSFGPIESELFLESQQSTLYDMFIETYDPPSTKKRKGRARAIPLAPQETQKQNHKKLAQNKKSSREFSAIRRESADRKRQKLEDVQSRALLYVAGRTPLHLGLAVFDHWDGQTLSLQGEQHKPRLWLSEDEASRKWVTWERDTFGECFGDTEHHLLKVINLSSATVPTPPNLTGAHIDKLHDAGFFRWEDGLLRLLGDRIPSLTVLHAKSRPLRRDRLEALSLRQDEDHSHSERIATESIPSQSASEEEQNTRNVHTDASDSDESADFVIGGAIKQLAIDWTEGADNDWERVERICDQLRTFEHDSKANVPEESADAVEYFLFKAKRGPDYLFATSAAVLLRSLGYQTRVISGFYADPDNYDRIAKATGVFPNNLHFWTEVQTDHGHWISVEPTPGFQVLYAKQTVFEVVAATFSGIVQRIVAKPFASLFAIVSVIAGFLLRGQIYSWLATLWWRVGMNTSPRQQVLRSILLLQRLTTQRKSGRQVGQTLDQWLETRSKTIRDSSALSEFRSLVSWACYASSDRPGIPAASVRQVCCESVKLLKEQV